MYKTKFKKRNHFRKNTRSHSNAKKQAPGWDKYINTVDSGNIEKNEYVPKNLFSGFPLNQELASRISAKGYDTPTEIQDKSINLILQGENLIGIAGTGTGKTAAFLIPIIQFLLKEKTDKYALVIAPTRELANQINDEFRSMTKGLGIYSTCLIGGSSVRESIKSLKRKNHIIIGTPGRLMDMHHQKYLSFDKFKILVLDEFDRMLDMGFKDEMKTINNKMDSKEQTLLFSATVDKSQKKLIKEIAGDAIEIKTSVNIQKTDAIKQEVLHVNGRDRFDIIHDMLIDQQEDKAILFCDTKRKAEKMVIQFKKTEVRADTIHGDKSQRAREIALRKFKRGQVNLLVATDVVARGIDVHDVSLVINYQPPRNYTDYVHRIGRTGRAGKTGRAVTLID